MMMTTTATSATSSTPVSTTAPTTSPPTDVPRKTVVTPGALSSSQDNKNKNVTTRCVRRGCKDVTTPTIECGNEKCTRQMHIACFKQLYVSKGYNKLDEGAIACTKKCYERQVMKSQAFQNPCWQTDGCEGCNNPNNLEKLLLTWLITKPNYHQFRGKGNNGKTKKQFAEEIASLLNDSGVTVRRDAKQVLNKIKHMESLFRKAYDFSNRETGAGILESQGKMAFQETVIMICPFYYDLEEVMADRAAAKPKALSQMLFSSSDEEEDKNDESSKKREHASDSQSTTSDHIVVPPPPQDSQATTQTTQTWTDKHNIDLLGQAMSGSTSSKPALSQDSIIESNSASEQSSEPQKKTSSNRRG